MECCFALRDGVVLAVAAQCATDLANSATAARRRLTAAPETNRKPHIADDKEVARRFDIEADPILVAALAKFAEPASLTVPMLKDDELVGVFAIYRTEVRPFTDKQIALLQNFRRPGGDRHRERAAAQRAAQAPRADRSARTPDGDLRGAAGHQHSPERPQPVFDTLVRSAARFVEAKFAIASSFPSDGELQLVAVRRPHAAGAED